MDLISIILLAVVCILLLVMIITTLNGRRDRSGSVSESIRYMSEMVAQSQRQGAEAQDKRLAELSRRLAILQQENSRQMQEVSRGLGEMKKLAGGVDDLSRILSNVKTRGILGEIQLGAILDQVLAPDQYAENVRTKSSGSERVEFALKLPGDGGGTVWLPIDAKFPVESYRALEEALDRGDRVAAHAAARNLQAVIMKSAKDIHEKYIEPPYTTDFGIMFLPVEGLYAEVVRMGMVETLQTKYKINIAGPTTMAALLNSLQMGFRTLAIQKHSSEVWQVLSSLKTEFDKFEDVLLKTQQRLDQAGRELEELVGRRTRAINRKLRDVQELEERDK
ncbi:MAG: DNA recombination protein RmuC [Anaerovoracaceae bacterium]|jgi:DNA recombination protein RmuC